MVNGLSYGAFLVLMTTQSTLQHSLPFTHSHTHSCSESISSTWEDWDRTADLLVGGWTALPLSHSRPMVDTFKTDEPHKTTNYSITNVSIQGLHLSQAAFKDGTARLSHFEGSFKRSRKYTWSLPRPDLLLQPVIQRGNGAGNSSEGRTRNPL